MNFVAQHMSLGETVSVYKESKDTKLGITFFRRDPQDDAPPNSAIVSRIGAQGPAKDILEVGQRITHVGGFEVEGPLHAAKMLRDSEGFLRITRLPKRDDFDANFERYMVKEQEAARAALESALPGQTPQATPRTDAATPRGPGAGAAIPQQFSSGLRPLNAGGGAVPPTLNMNNLGDGLQTAGAQLSARSQQIQAEMAQNIGNLSARAGAFFQKLGNQINTAAEFIPTQVNKETRAVKKIQKAWRGYAARGMFHEERGAVLMLQAAQRRAKAKKVVEYKKSLKYWAAVVIQERWRRYQIRKKAKALEAAKGEVATPKKTGVGAKIVKSLSFSRRSSKKPAKPVKPDDITDDDLISARGAGPDRTMHLGMPVESKGPETPGAEPTGGKQVNKRSFSFGRRKKAEPAAEKAHV